ncbi:MAG TPA: CBS domain-containing protein [Ktedonosporobacter sp.]|nr:CBS domain-containing protein [Ktedonosporobacter sp.]
MQVKDIMTTQVITVNEEHTKQQAARLLSEHRISGLPVVNADNIAIGVVTEYDVIARKGQRVGDIMTRGVISVTEDTDLEEVREILINERIKRLLVLDQGKLVGVVSRADLVQEIAMRWVCPVCGEVMHSLQAPETCSRCGTTAITTLSEPVSPGF